MTPFLLREIARECCEALYLHHDSSLCACAIITKHLRRVAEPPSVLAGVPPAGVEETTEDILGSLPPPLPATKIGRFTCYQKANEDGTFPDEPRHADQIKQLREQRDAAEKALRAVCSTDDFRPPGIWRNARAVLAAAASRSSEATRTAGEVGGEESDAVQR